MKDAHKLTRNPLGIIGLFIVLIYALASVVFSVSGTGMDPIERRTVVFFLVLFPVLVLVVFVWLVTRHHGKLYAPYDFQADNAFLQTLGPESQGRRFEQEIAAQNAFESEASRTPQALEEQSGALVLSPPVSPSQETTTLPTSQDDQAPRAETRAVQPSHASSKVARADYLLAEELVIRELEAHFRVPAYRHVVLRLPSRDVESQRQPTVEIAFDAVFERTDHLAAVEVKLISGNKVRLDIVSHILQKILDVDRLLLMGAPRSVKVFIALVSHENRGLAEEIRHKITEQLSKAGELRVKCDVSVFELPKLKRTFGLE